MVTKSEQSLGTAKFPVKGQCQQQNQSQQQQLKQKDATESIDFEQLTQNPLVSKFFDEADQKSCATPAEVSTKQVRNNCLWYTSRYQRNNSSNFSDGSASCSPRTMETDKTTVKTGEFREILNKKLDEIIKEGVLDSIIPFICPMPLPTNYSSRLKLKKCQQPQQQKQHQQEDNNKDFLQSANMACSNNTSSQSSNIPTIQNCQEIDDKSGCITSSISKKISPCKQSTSRRKLNVQNVNCEQGVELNPSNKKSSDIIIHVNDEGKNMTKAFTCPHELIINQMGYFADVSNGYNLNEMDISVHCDIQIFEWLMEWVQWNAQNDVQSNPENAPALGCNNVITILVSATFLKIEPLILECLRYCHSNLSEVVRTSSNLNCLNDDIINRLAAMFTNVELQMVVDKKNRLTPRLWIKLIQSLCEIEPETLRGHFFTAAGLFKCSRCHQYVTSAMKSYIMCVPRNMRLNRWGQVISHHTRDPNWDLNSYIKQLFKEMKSWRLVYWRLWGHCHYLYCCVCETYFPGYQMNLCRFHTDCPTYLGPVVEGRMTGPIGRYPCCGQQVFRYETIPTPSGCRFRDHSVLVETDRERTILSICQMAIDDVEVSPSWKFEEPAVKDDYQAQWSDMSLLPQCGRKGLLPPLDGSNGKLTRMLSQRSKWYEPKYFFDSTTDTESSLDLNSSNAFGKKKDKYLSKKDTFESYSCTPSGSSDDDDYDSTNDRGTTKSDIGRKKKRRNYSFWNYHNKKLKRIRNVENPGRIWAGDLSARCNQDHQREYEERVIKQILEYMQNKSSAALHSRATDKPIGGTYVRLENEWREQIRHRIVNYNNSSSFSFGICSNSLNYSYHGS